MCRFFFDFYGFYSEASGTLWWIRVLRSGFEADALDFQGANICIQLLPQFSQTLSENVFAEGSSLESWKSILLNTAYTKVYISLRIFKLCCKRYVCHLSVYIYVTCQHVDK